MPTKKKKKEKKGNLKESTNFSQPNIPEWISPQPKEPSSTL